MTINTAGETCSNYPLFVLQEDSSLLARIRGERPPSFLDKRSPILPPASPNPRGTYRKPTPGLDATPSTLSCLCTHPYHFHTASTLNRRRKRPTTTKIVTPRPPQVVKLQRPTSPRSTGKSTRLETKGGCVKAETVNSESEAQDFLRQRGRKGQPAFGARNRTGCAEGSRTLVARLSFSGTRILDLRR